MAYLLYRAGLYRSWTQYIWRKLFDNTGDYHNLGEHAKSSYGQVGYYHVLDALNQDYIVSVAPRSSPNGPCISLFDGASWTNYDIPAMTKWFYPTGVFVRAVDDVTIVGRWSDNSESRVCHWTGPTGSFTDVQAIGSSGCYQPAVTGSRGGTLTVMSGESGNSNVYTGSGGSWTLQGTWGSDCRGLAPGVYTTRRVFDGPSATCLLLNGVGEGIPSPGKGWVQEGKGVYVGGGAVFVELYRGDGWNNHYHVMKYDGSWSELTSLWAGLGYGGGFSDNDNVFCLANRRTGISSCSNCGRTWYTFDNGSTWTEDSTWTDDSGSQHEYPGGVACFEIPIADNQVPAPDSSGTDFSTIEFDVIDKDNALATAGSWIDVKIDAGSYVRVWDAGAFGNGWTGTVSSISDGWHFSLTPPASSPGTPTIWVKANIYNDIGNHTLLDDNRSYQTGPSSWTASGYPDGSGWWTFDGNFYAPPQLTPIDPTSGETGVSPSAVVNLQIDGIGLTEPWTLHIDRGAGWELAMTYDGGATFEPQFQGVESSITIVSDTYTIAIHPRTPFAYSQTVQVKATVTNAGGDIVLA
jgi:hypothetical protein